MYMSAIGHGGPHPLALHGEPDRRDHRAVLPGTGRRPLLRHRAGAGRAAPAGRRWSCSWPAAGCRQPDALHRCCCSCTTCATCRRSASPTRSPSTTSPNQEKQFPLIRVFGTIGWIVAGPVRRFVLSRSRRARRATPLPLYTAGVASLLLGLYSFTLPHTPPPGAGRRRRSRSILGLDALSQLGSRSVLRLHRSARS